MGTAFEKQIKAIEDHGKSQSSAIKESWKQIIESNDIAKMILIFREVAHHMKSKKKYLIVL